MSILSQAERATIAIDTHEDCYSGDRYTWTAWSKIVDWLAAQDFDAHQIEQILRSKLTRWAADHAGKYDGVTLKEFQKFWNDCQSTVEHVMKEIDELA